MGGGLRAAVLDTTSPVPVAPVAPVACSKNADLAVFYGTSASARSQNRAPHPMGLHGAQRDPQAPQEVPNGWQKDPHLREFVQNDSKNSKSHQFGIIRILKNQKH